jgi:hypothetical protein
MGLRRAILIMEEFTDKEMSIIEEAILRENQLRALHKAIDSATPKKAAKIEAEALPGYITRNFNAQQKLQPIMEKHGLVRK